MHDLRNRLTLAAALLGATALPVLAHAESRPIGPEPHPHTTEQGRFLIEWNTFEIGIERWNRQQGEPRTTRLQSSLLTKYGLTDNLELQLGFPGFIRIEQRDTDTGETQATRGLDDLLIAAKLNVFGNDEGDWAAAVRPFVRLPSATGGVGERWVSFGLQLPLAWAISDQTTLELTPVFAARAKDPDNGFILDTGALLSFNQVIAESTEAFVEFEAAFSSEPSEKWIGQVNLGLTFAIDENTVIEPSISVGVTRSAEDFTFGLVLVRRF